MCVIISGHLLSLQFAKPQDGSIIPNIKECLSVLSCIRVEINETCITSIMNEFM